MAFSDSYDGSPEAGVSRQMTAHQWQKLYSDAWRAECSSESSLRWKLSSAFASAVSDVFIGQTADLNIATLVAGELESTLSKCDDLPFDDQASTLAYLLWHEIDRYERVSESLDLLFERGLLPIAKPKRELRVLEVGSGPAPASYAVAHYYTALGLWSRTTNSEFESSIGTDIYTLDRGQGWGPLVHTLSEALPGRGGRASAVRLFGTKYENLAGFRPREIHREAREHHKTTLLHDDESCLYEGWPDDTVVDRVAARMSPPSAYDLIVVANFLTNTETFESLRHDLETLANSLVPGGVLLTLSGTGGKYLDLWREFTALNSVRRLDHHVDEVIHPHSNPAVHQRVTGTLLEGLSHLRAVAREAMKQVTLPGDVSQALRRREQISGTEQPGADVATREVTYPSFRLLAFKRGGRAMTKKERARIARRRLYGGS